MKARTSVLAAALLAICAGALPAFDWGGTLDNRSTLTYQETASFLQEDKLALWLEAELGKGLTLTAQGSYTFTSERPYLFDIDLLRLEGQYPLELATPAVLSFTAGRFPLLEFSTRVLQATVDGAQVRFGNARLNASLALAFTGLALEPISPVSLTWADENSAGPLAAPRLVELAQVEFPELFGRHDLRLALLAQQDLRAVDQLSVYQEGDPVSVSGNVGGCLSSEYLGVGAGGPLGPGLYYDAFAWLGTGRTLYDEGGDNLGSYEQAWIVSALIGASLRYYREEWRSSRGQLGLLLATGDGDYTGSYFEGNTEGLATAFVSVSSSQLGLVFSPRVGNLAALQASWSVKPFEVLQTELTGWVFLRPSTGQISDPRIDLTSDSRYLGSEIDLKANLRPFSDLGGALSLGLFLPGSAFGSAYRDPEFRGRLEISFAF